MRRRSSGILKMFAKALMGRSGEAACAVSRDSALRVAAGLRRLDQLDLAAGLLDLLLGARAEGVRAHGQGLGRARPCRGS